jgi:hypothetical protein
LEHPKERKGRARGDKEEVEPDAAAEAAVGPWSNTGEGAVMGGRALGRERIRAILSLIGLSRVTFVGANIE